MIGRGSVSPVKEGAKGFFPETNSNSWGLLNPLKGREKPAGAERKIGN